MGAGPKPLALALTPHLPCVYVCVCVSVLIYYKVRTIFFLFKGEDLVLVLGLELG